MKKYFCIIVSILCLYLVVGAVSNGIEASPSTKKLITSFPDVKNNLYANEAVAEKKDRDSVKDHEKEHFVLSDEVIVLESGVMSTSVLDLKTLNQQPTASLVKAEHNSKENSAKTQAQQEKAPVKEDEKKLTENEGKAIVNDLLTGVVGTFDRLGKEHQWSYENPPDFEILRPELLKYASESFTDGFLKDVKDDFYCSCDMLPYPNAALDIRFQLHENSSNRFVASSIEFDNMISSGSTIYFTVVKENGKWVLDQYKWVSIDKEPISLTWDEIKAHEEKQGEKVELLNTTTYEGEKVYIFKYVKSGKIMGVFANNSGYMWDVPPDLMP